MHSGANLSSHHVITKPASVSTTGMVAAQHRRAAEAGSAILAEGGNAVDAAIATSFAIGVVEPWMSGLGGGGYMVIRQPGEAGAKVVEFGMKSPAALNPADYPLTGGVASDLFPWPSVLDDRNVIGGTAVALPGAVDGMRVAHENFGSMKWADLLSPAIQLAGEGSLVDWYAQLLISGVARDLNRFPKSKATFLEEDGYPIASAWTALAEKRLDQSSYAETLRVLAEQGGRAFYEGEIARSLVEDLQQEGSAISEADLAGYEARVVSALRLELDEGEIFATPELTAGPTLARFYELLGKASMGRSYLGPDAYLAYARSLFTAYEERLTRMGDVEGGRGCTTHFNVVDRDGTMVAVTQTLLSIFGSRLMLPQTGVLMNNGLMWFDPEQGKPNSLQPSKKCLSNMCPILGERSDGLQFALGASGGRKILPAVAQLSSFILDYELDLDAAFHTPRIDVSGGDTVVYDEKIGRLTRKLLEENFTAIAAPRTMYPYNFGCPSGVTADNGSFAGATEIMSPWGDAISPDQ